MLLTSFMLWIGASLLIAAISRSVQGSKVGLLLALLFLPIPLFAPASPLWRLLLASAFIWLVLRTADIAFNPMSASFGWRWAHLVLLPDIRYATSCERRMDFEAAAKALAFLLVGIGIVLVFLSVPIRTGGHLPFLWGLVALAVIVVFEFAVALISFVGAAVGIELPQINDAPLKSRTVSEFWSRRWNRVMSRMLFDLIFRPISRRGASLALVASFVASAAIHAYALSAAAGVAAASLWALFFLVQPIVVMVERQLGVKNWSIMLGRGWTVSVLALLLPLFSHPILRLAGQS